MPTPSSGSISFSSISSELGLSSSAQISLGSTNTRTLAGVASGQISLGSNLYNKNSAPSWSTASGSIGSNYTQRSSSFSVSASGLFGATYSVVSGSIPAGQSLNASNGVISGTPSGVSDFSSNTFNFSIRATSSTGKYSDRAFSITIVSRYVGYRCKTAGEGQSVSDTAPSGMVFNRVDFSSYGTPNGECGSFSYGGCNSVGSNKYNPTPTTSYSVAATNAQWGDPCIGTAKRMYVQMSYGPF